MKANPAAARPGTESVARQHHARDARFGLNQLIAPREARQSHARRTRHGDYIPLPSRVHELGLHPETLVKMARAGRCRGAIKVGAGVAVPARES